jgi:hypothetical protein
MKDISAFKWEAGPSKPIDKGVKVLIIMKDISAFKWEACPSEPTDKGVKVLIINKFYKCMHPIMFIEC